MGQGVRRDQSTSSFYGGRRFTPLMRHQATTENERVWQPGEVLPAPGVTADQMDELKTSIHSIIASMQAGISTELSRLTDTLSQLDQRVSTIEENYSNHILCSPLPYTPASSAS